MDLNLRNEIVKITADLLQNVMPTNMLGCLDDFGDEPDRTTDDMDEARLFYEMFQRKRRNDASHKPDTSIEEQHDVNATDDRNEFENSKSHDGEGDNEMENDLFEADIADDSDYENTALDIGNAMTYYEILEQEILNQLNIRTEDIEVSHLNKIHFYVSKYESFSLFMFFQFLSRLLTSIELIDTNWLNELDIHSIHRLTYLFVYAIMSEYSFNDIDKEFCVSAGVTKKAVHKVCSILAAHKHMFFRLPNDIEIDENVDDFAQFNDYGQFEFQNVFGAMGMIDVDIMPAITGYYSVNQTDDPSSSYTPAKLQCSCDANGFLQSSFVLIPEIELDTKNAEAFKLSPLYTALDYRPADRNHMVADYSFTSIPFLLTPLEEDGAGAEQFNRALESKRLIIDQTFSIIQNRFTILNRIDSDDAKAVCNLIESVCVIYNIFIANGGSYVISDP